MNVSIAPAGAPNGRSSADEKSRTTGSTASKADVARVSCSSGPLMPDVGMSLAGCQLASATVPPISATPTWNAPTQSGTDPDVGRATRDRQWSCGLQRLVTAVYPIPQSRTPFSDGARHEVAF